MDIPPSSPQSSDILPPREKIAIGRVLEFDKDVSYEDVLAARVFRKALGGQAFVFGLILALLGYVGFDLKKKSEALHDAQSALALKQDSLRRDMDTTRAHMADYQQKMQGRVAEADRLVKNADGVVQSANSYQLALANQLLSLGQIQRSTQELQGTETSLRREVTTSLHNISTEVDASTLQRQKDSTALAATIDHAERATRGLSNTIIQVVEEDSPTPIGNSEFTLEFDDLKAHGCMITRVKLQYARASVPGWPREQVMVGVPIPVVVGGHRYSLTVLRGNSRHGKLLFFMVTGRVLVRLRKLDDVTAGSLDASADTIAECEPLPSHE